MLAADIPPPPPDLLARPERWLPGGDTDGMKPHAGVAMIIAMAATAVRVVNILSQQKLLLPQTALVCAQAADALLFSAPLSVTPNSQSTRQWDVSFAPSLLGLDGGTLSESARPTLLSVSLSLSCLHLTPLVPLLDPLHRMPLDATFELAAVTNGRSRVH